MSSSGLSKVHDSSMSFTFIVHKTVSMLRFLVNISHWFTGVYTATIKDSCWHCCSVWLNLLQDCHSPKIVKQICARPFPTDKFQFENKIFSRYIKIRWPKGHNFLQSLIYETFEFCTIISAIIGTNCDQIWIVHPESDLVGWILAFQSEKINIPKWRCYSDKLTLVNA